MAIAIGPPGPDSLPRRLLFPCIRWGAEYGSSGANRAQKGFTTMTNAEATTTENTAAVGEPGAPKGQKTARGKAQTPEPKKEAKAGKKAPKPARAKETSTPRAESKGATILELIGRP